MTFERGAAAPPKTKLYKMIKFQLCLESVIITVSSFCYWDTGLLCFVFLSDYSNRNKFIIRFLVMWTKHEGILQEVSQCI